MNGSRRRARPRLSFVGSGRIRNELLWHREKQPQSELLTESPRVGGSARPWPPWPDSASLIPDDDSRVDAGSVCESHVVVIRPNGGSSDRE